MGVERSLRRSGKGNTGKKVEKKRPPERTRTGFRGGDCGPGGHCWDGVWLFGIGMWGRFWNITLSGEFTVLRTRGGRHGRRISPEKSDQGQAKTVHGEETLQGWITQKTRS